MGAPGERTFYLQARGAGRLVSVALEKVQVSLLAEKLDELLIEANRRFGLTLPDTEGSTRPTTSRSTTRSTRSSGSARSVSRTTSTPPPWSSRRSRSARPRKRPTRPSDDDESRTTRTSRPATADLDRLRVRLTPAETRAFIERAKRVDRRRPAAVPAVRPAARPGRAPLPAAQRLPPVAVRDRVARRAATRWSFSRHGELDIEGRLVDASNTTLRAVITLEGVTARCVYKPVRGERPLWDFPDGTLAGREVSRVPGRRRDRLGPRCRRRCCETARSARACVSCGSTTTRGLADEDDPRASFRPASRAGRLAPDRGGRGRRRLARTCWRTPTIRGWPGWPRSTR